MEKAQKIVFLSIKLKSRMHNKKTWAFNRKSIFSPPKKEKTDRTSSTDSK